MAGEQHPGAKRFRHHGVNDGDAVADAETHVRRNGRTFGEADGFERRTVEIHPDSGHLLGGGSTGIPVFPWLPFRVRALFALDLIFVGTPQ